MPPLPCPQRRRLQATSPRVSQAELIKLRAPTVQSASYKPFSGCVPCPVLASALPYCRILGSAPRYTPCPCILVHGSDSGETHTKADSRQLKVKPRRYQPQVLWARNNIASERSQSQLRPLLTPGGLCAQHFILCKAHSHLPASTASERDRPLPCPPTTP